MTNMFEFLYQSAFKQVGSSPQVLLISLSFANLSRSVLCPVSHLLLQPQGKKQQPDFYQKSSPFPPPATPFATTLAIGINKLTFAKITKVQAGWLGNESLNAC